MKIAVIGPPTRISGSTKIAFGQAAALLKRGHDVKLVLQQKGLAEVKRAYQGIFPDSRIIEVPQTPLMTNVVDHMTRGLRTLQYGAETPLTGDVWYENKTGTNESKHPQHGTKTEGYVDLASMIVRSFQLSSILSSWKCEAIVPHASLMCLSALRYYLNSQNRRVLYLLDMPASKTLEIENKSQLIVDPLRRLERFLVTRADAVACNNTLVNRDWSSSMGILPKLVLPGCNPSPNFQKNRGEYILTVTHWYPSKRPSYFLGLAQSLSSSKLSIVMAGHWPIKSDLEEMRNKVVELGLSEKLKIYPEPTEDELREMYRFARCFFAPPLAGGFIIAAMEAASYGTPIIYPRSAGAWDAFQPGVHGLAINVEDMGKVTSDVRQFESLELVREMGYQIWQRSKELSWENHAIRMEELLRKD